MIAQDSLNDNEKLIDETVTEEIVSQEKDEVTTPSTEATDDQDTPQVEQTPEEEVVAEAVEPVESPADETKEEEAPEATAPDPTAEGEEVKEAETEEEKSDEEDSNDEKVAEQTSDREEEEDLSFLDETELINRLRELLDLDISKVRSKIESIKIHFYKKYKARSEEEREKFLQDGGEDRDFVPENSKLEEEFKELYNQYRAERAKLASRIKDEQENNLLRKNHIIEQIKQLVESKEDVSSHINTFRDLQQEWKNTGSVPVEASNELWRQYNQQQEAFWDLIKINNELREYDFRKNLEAKNKLIEAAVELDKEKDVITAFRTLQTLHDKWRELGPVARELREETWQRFKEASSVINRKHQSHFEGVREIEQRNLVLKTELCEKVEAIDTAPLNSYKAWDNATKEILNLQEEWRSIGFAPRKENQRIFERYRAACDKFFAAKAAFYKEMKSNLNENLEKKTALCEKAEEMKDRTDWKEATDDFIKIQQEWKTIGPVMKKHSDDIWKRFIAACDYFFEQRNKNMSGKRNEEMKNLELKESIIEKIKVFKKGDNTSESLAELRALAAEWNSVGHVPYRDKDKIYKAYRTALDAKFDELNIDVAERRMESFRSNLKDISSRGDNRLYREREKLVRAYEHLKSEIATYENNIGFLSISSKKGGGMLQEMERKIETLKEECNMLEQKINLIDEQL